MLACCITETMSAGGGFYTLVFDSKPRVQTLWPVPALPGLRDHRKRKSSLFQPLQVLLTRKCMDANLLSPGCWWVVNGRESQEGGCTLQPTSWHQGVLLLPPPKSLLVKQVCKRRFSCWSVQLQWACQWRSLKYLKSQIRKSLPHIPVWAYFSLLSTASPQASFKSRSHSKQPPSPVQELRNNQQ